MRLSLGLSVALNMLLLTTIVAARVDPTYDAVTDRLGSDPALRLDAAPSELRSVEAIGDLLEVLQQTALPADDIKTLVLGWLQARYEDADEAGQPEYWQPGFSPLLADLAQRVAIGQALREALTAVFGTDAVHDPVFDPVFRPLGRAYSFLGSEAQISLQRRQLELLEARDPPGRTETVAAAGCLVRDLANTDARLMPSMLPGGLGASAETEYELRFSPLSQQLRESAVAADEDEFRALFDLLRRLEQDASPMNQAKIRTDLRALMGDADFDRFWSLRDPFFGPIEEYLEREGFPAHQVQAAYAIVNDSQEALLRSVGQQRDQTSMLIAVGQVSRDEAARLTRLLGEEAAAGLRIVMSRAAMKLSGSSPAGC